MAEEDTVAVLDPETATEDEAPEGETAEDSVEETEEQEEGSETAPDIETIKAEVARETEAKIRAEVTEEAERNAIEQTRARNQQFMSQRAFDLLRTQVYRAAKHAEEGKSPEDIANGLQRIGVNELVEGLQSYVYQDAYDGLEKHFFGYVQKHAPDYKPDARVMQKYAQEVATKQTDRVFTAMYDLMRDHILATEVPKRLEEERKVAAEKNKKGEAVKNLQNPAKSPGPVKATGSSVATVDLSEIIADANRPQAERRAAYKKLHGMDPPF